MEEGFGKRRGGGIYAFWGMLVEGRLKGGRKSKEMGKRRGRGLFTALSSSPMPVPQ